MDCCTTVAISDDCLYNLPVTKGNFTTLDTVSNPANQWPLIPWTINLLFTTVCVFNAGYQFIMITGALPPRYCLKSWACLLVAAVSRNPSKSGKENFVSLPTAVVVCTIVCVLALLNHHITKLQAHTMALTQDKRWFITLNLCPFSNTYFGLRLLLALSMPVRPYHVRTMEKHIINM